MALRDVSLVCTQIVKWSILESDFSVATGELSKCAANGCHVLKSLSCFCVILAPTLKLKRPYIIGKYMEYIQSFYTSD